MYICNNKNQYVCIYTNVHVYILLSTNRLFHCITTLLCGYIYIYIYIYIYVLSVRTGVGEESCL